MRPTVHLLVLLVVAGCSGDPPAGDPDGGEDAIGDPWFPCEECDDGDPCTMGRCNPLTVTCENIPLDRDGDRYPARSAEDGTPCGGIDCNDADPAVHPGARETCADGVDQDCDDVVDGFGMIGDPVYVDTVSTDSYYPDVVWTGSRFAISWSVRSGTWTTNNMFLAFVSADGEPGDVSLAVHDSQFISNLMWTGSHLVLAWSNVGSGVSLLGMLPDGTEQWTTETLFFQGEYSIVWTGRGFGALWTPRSSAEDDIQFMLLDETGTPLSGAINVDDEPDMRDWHCSLAWTGSTFLATWLRYDGGYYDTYLRTIGPLGELPGPGRPLTTRGDAYTPPAVAWSGSQYGITTGNEFYGVFLLRADRDGYLVGEPTRVSPPGQRPAGHDVIWAGSVFAVTWSAITYDWGSPAVVLVDRDGEVVSDVLYASPEGTADPAYWDGGAIHSMTWTGSEIGLAWTDWRVDAETRDCSMESCDSLVHFARLGWCE